ncbi:MAG TPA: pyrroloquinoline quinone biosynthesis peptide chaperone PqqD [Burkholderiales bacterium]
MNAPRADEVIELARLYRFQWEEAQQAYVLLFPEGMVKLNPSAGEILKRVDGRRTVAEIIRDLEAAFPGADLRQDVVDFIEEAYANGWLRTRPA